MRAYTRNIVTTERALDRIAVRQSAARSRNAIACRGVNIRLARRCIDATRKPLHRRSIERHAAGVGDALRTWRQP